jgi:tetrahydromethanopterin S-methyltransferase subunit G
MKIDIDVADLNDLIKRLEHVPENVEQAASRALGRAGVAVPP